MYTYIRGGSRIFVRGGLTFIAKVKNKKKKGLLYLPHTLAYLKHII